MTNKKVCCICGKTFTGWGNNPWPIKDDGECCESCNTMLVVPERIRRYYKSEEEVEKNNES